MITLNRNTMNDLMEKVCCAVALACSIEMTAVEGMKMTKQTDIETTESEPKSTLTTLRDSHEDMESSKIEIGSFVTCNEEWSKMQLCLSEVFITLNVSKHLNCEDLKILLPILANCVKLSSEQKVRLDSFQVIFKLLCTKHWDSIRCAVEGEKLDKCAVANLLLIINFFDAVIKTPWVPEPNDYALIFDIAQLARDAKYDIQSILSSDSTEVIKSYGEYLSEIVDQQIKERGIDAIFMRMQ